MDGLITLLFSEMLQTAWLYGGINVVSNRYDGKTHTFCSLTILLQVRYFNIG